MDYDCHIDLGSRSYPIYIRPGCFASAGSLIAQTLAAGTSCLVVSDETVAKLYAETLLGQLREAGLRAELATFPAGEPAKNIESAAALWNACGEHRIDRAGAIIALGGGVTGDMAGFVAASWMRGIHFIQIPTTLLAMVDSSVGGKTAVNVAAGKNLVGAFKQPNVVVIDPELLHSMDAREYRAGLAEVVKYGVIKDPEFFTWQQSNHARLLQRDNEAIAHAVQRSCQLKAWYVANDEREQGVRAHLNYGHTFGHAIEGETGYTRYLHGEAVAIGMGMAAYCSEQLGLLPNDDLRQQQTELLNAFALPTVHQSADAEQEIQSLMQRCHIDKKVVRGSVRFILPSALGSVDVVADPNTMAVEAGFRAGVVA